MFHDDRADGDGTTARGADGLDDRLRAARIAAVVDDDRGAGLRQASGDPGPDPAGSRGHERHPAREVEQVRAGRGGAGHRGNGFGPVAVTRRWGTQSSTWTKPSNVAPWRTRTSYSDRRWNFTWVKSSKRT